LINAIKLSVNKSIAVVTRTWWWQDDCEGGRQHSRSDNRHEARRLDRDGDTGARAVVVVPETRATNKTVKTVARAVVVVPETRATSETVKTGARAVAVVPEE